MYSFFTIGSWDCRADEAVAKDFGIDPRATADSSTPLYAIHLRLPLPTIELVPLLQAIPVLSILNLKKQSASCAGIDFSIAEACRFPPSPNGPSSLRAKADWLKTIGDHASHIKITACSLLTLTMAWALFQQLRDLWHGRRAPLCY